MKQPKFIFITGGVVSSLGKGISAGSLGRILKNRGLKVFMQKLDPYINVDPGKMSPLQHGEVFVTDDGAETDLDLGHYERFIDENLNRNCSVSAGKVYSEVIEKERQGLYDGRTVQVIPHITNQIKEFIWLAAKTSGADVIITEIGGTVGDFESLPFLEAIRQMRRDIGHENCFYMHTTLVPYLRASREIKTKPTQHSVKELRSLGILPDAIILRTEKKLTKGEKEKIALFCDVDYESIIEVRDRKILYEVVNDLLRQKADEIVCQHFGLDLPPADLADWNEMIARIKNSSGSVTITIFGNYVALRDAYLSQIEALKHASYVFQVGVDIKMFNPKDLSMKELSEIISNTDGIILSDFDTGEVCESKLQVVQIAKEKDIPFMGINNGMYTMLLDSFRNFENTNLEHYIEKQSQTYIGKHNVKLLEANNKIYSSQLIQERFRSNLKIKPSITSIIEDMKLTTLGKNEDDNIVMICDQALSWFIGCQFNPEFLSRPNRAHPLFVDFLKTIVSQKD